MLRIGVVGAGGRMGREVCRAVAAEAGLVLAAAVDVGYAGQPLQALVGDAGGDLRVEADVGSLGDAGVEVVVDFTVAAAFRAAVPRYVELGVHAVVGTTGIEPEELVEAGSAFAAAGLGLLVAANFAIGAVLMMRFAELAAPYMAGADIVELHHDAKLDAPSGTAMQTAHRMADARRRAHLQQWPADRTATEAIAGSRGGAGPGGVRVHAVRLPGLVAHQQVVLGAVGQSLTIRHDAYDRTSFMPGVLLAVRAVGRRPGLTTGLDDLLGL